MGTAIKNPMPDHLRRSDGASECPDVKNYKWRLNPVWHGILYSCTHMATVGVKGLTITLLLILCNMFSSETFIDFT